VRYWFNAAKLYIFFESALFLSGFCRKNKEILTFAALFKHQQNLS